jgi:hypothetical protein
MTTTISKKDFDKALQDNVVLKLKGGTGGYLRINITGEKRSSINNLVVGDQVIDAIGIAYQEENGVRTYSLNGVEINTKQGKDITHTYPRNDNSSPVQKWKEVQDSDNVVKPYEDEYLSWERGEKAGWNMGIDGLAICIPALLITLVLTITSIYVPAVPLIAIGITLGITVVSGLYAAVGAGRMNHYGAKLEPYRSAQESTNTLQENASFTNNKPYRSGDLSCSQQNPSLPLNQTKTGSGLEQRERPSVCSGEHTQTRREDHASSRKNSR